MTMDLMTVAKAAAESRFFPHITSPARAFMILLAGQEMGAGPASALRNIRYADGQLTLQAGIVSATIKRSEKYDYAVKSHGDEECVLEFLDRKTGAILGESKFTMEDAKQADLLITNKGNQALNWKRYPRNMLFARALTNGARWYCPDVFGGSVYTPDELGDPGEAFDGEDPSTSSTGSGQAGSGQAGSGQADGQSDASADGDSKTDAQADERKKLADAFAAQMEKEEAIDSRGDSPSPKGFGEQAAESAGKTEGKADERPEHLKKLDALCEKYSLGDAQKRAWCKHFKVKSIEDLTAEHVGKIVVTAEKKFGAAA